MEKMDDAGFMKRAIELSRSSAERPGTAPFAAIIVKDGKVVGEGLNHVGAKHDPTSHGEIEAIRDACATLATTDLSGTTMYASCEPCAMCVMAMYRAGVGRLVYGMSLTQSLALLPPPVDTSFILREAVKPVGSRSVPALQMMADEACEALLDWNKRSEQG